MFINMKTTLKFILLFCFFFNFSFSQDYLEEVTKTFENGQPMFIDYLEIEDLKKVKTDIFNEKGFLIFSISFNKENGLPDGEFFDLINKGYFKNGVLNCEDCMLVESNTPSVFTYNYDKQNNYITNGDVINGRFRGKIEKFAFFEGTYRKVDWESTRRYVAAGAGVGFRDVKTYGTSKFNKTPSEFVYYNDNGQIEGNYTKRYRSTDNKIIQIDTEVVDGLIKTYVVKNDKGRIVDSLSNQNKIWKINYKFKKNSGLLVFNGFENLQKSKSDYIICYNGQIDQRFSQGTLREQTKINPIVPVGGNVSIDYVDGGASIRQRQMNTGGKPSILDSNGLYTIYNKNLSNSYLNNLYLDVTNDFSLYANRGFSWDTTRDDNLFTIIYNYLVNGDDIPFLRKKFNEIEGPRFGGGSLVQYESLFYFKGIFDNEINSKNVANTFNFETIYINRNGLEFTTKIVPNTFKKHLIPPFNKVVRPFSEYIKNSTLPLFFSKVISLSGYLKSISEIFSSDYVESKELYVWNSKSNKYDLVDFKKLIELADNNETKVSELNSDDLFDDSDYSVIYTSDKNGRAQYNNVLYNQLSESVPKLEQLRKKGVNGRFDYDDYYRIYFNDLNILLNYDENTTQWNDGIRVNIIGKDKIRLFVIIRFSEDQTKIEEDFTEGEPNSDARGLENTINRISQTLNKSPEWVKKYIDVGSMSESEVSELNRDDLFDDSDYFVNYTSDKNGKGIYTDTLDDFFTESVIKIETVKKRGEKRKYSNYIKVYLNDLNKLINYDEYTTNWGNSVELIGKDKIRLFVIIRILN
jgi:hypothetical protein